MHFSLFSCFSCVFHFSGAFHFSRVFHILFTFQVCIYIHMHTCAPHASLNTKLAFPMHPMKDQVKMRNLCWTSCFCCFSGAFHEKHTFYEKRTLFTKSAGDFHEKRTVFMKSIRFSPTKFMSFWVITKYRSFDTKDQIFCSAKMGVKLVQCRKRTTPSYCSNRRVTLSKDPLLNGLFQNVNRYFAEI